MYKLIAVALGAVVALAALPASAADNAQQDKMKTCNTKAGAMKGDDRKEFMKACLSGDEATQTKLTAQQEKMKTCNQKATGMNGDSRKAFMKTCLSGDAAAAPAAAKASTTPMSQQDKMKACNAKAGDMKGDDRKKFMSTCLSG
jgi:hypothetical protein